MSAGMAEFIAAHALWQGQMGDVSAAECQCGQNHGAFNAFAGTAAILDFAAIHAAHVAEELTKAGYGNVQEALLTAADEMPIETLGGADKASLWLRQRAHSLDPEGRALVKAIHDRKAGV